jgi:hypothetical protein
VWGFFVSPTWREYELKGVNMTIGSTRAGVTQAKHNQEATWIVGLDALVAGVAAYVWFQSGVAAIGVGIGAGILTMIPGIGLIFGALMSGLYGWAGYGMAHAFKNTDGTCWAVAIVVGLIALGLHAAAHQHALDLNAK